MSHTLSGRFLLFFKIFAGFPHGRILHSYKSQSRGFSLANDTAVAVTYREALRAAVRFHHLSLFPQTQGPPCPQWSSTNLDVEAKKMRKRALTDLPPTCDMTDALAFIPVRRGIFEGLLSATLPRKRPLINSPSQKLYIIQLKFRAICLVKG